MTHEKIYPPTQKDDNKDTAELRYVEGVFFECFGIPYKWAAQMAQWDCPLGERWREALNYFWNGGDTNGSVQK